jgi:hypothetical protein
MIFSHSQSDFESEKERNLYYKIFAGYFFNELIPGYDDRLTKFCHLLNEPIARGASASSSPILLNPKRVHVSFDNHLYLFSQLRTDRGEFADIIIHDDTNRILVPIEVKLHSNWSYKKDVLANQERHDQLQSILPNINIVPILLLTRFRWERASNKESSEHSNYMKFHQDPKCRFRVILWEQVADFIPENKVREYLNSQLERYQRGISYRIDKDWFVQQSIKTMNA